MLFIIMWKYDKISQLFLYNIFANKDYLKWDLQFKLYKVWNYWK